MALIKDMYRKKELQVKGLLEINSNMKGVGEKCNNMGGIR